MNQSQWEEDTQNELGYGQLFAKLWHRRYWFLGVFSGILAIAVPISLLKQPIYQSYMQVLVESNYQGKDISSNSDNKYLEQQFADAAIEIDYATQLKVLKSSEILKRVVEELKLDSSEATKSQVIAQLQSSLSVSQLIDEQSGKSKNSDITKIIQAVYTGTSPTETKQVLEAIQKVYLDYNLEQQEKRLKNGLTFINKQIPQARNELTKTEASLTKLSRKNNLISPEEEAIALKENITEIIKERNNLKAEGSQTQGNYSNVQDQLGLSPANAQAIARLNQSPGYQNLLNELQEIEVNLAKERTKFKDNSPIVQKLINQRDTQKAVLTQYATKTLGTLPPNFMEELESLPKQGQLSSINLIDKISEAQSSITGIESRDTSLAQTQAQLEQKLIEFPNLISQYKNLTQEAEIKRQALQRLLEAKQELEIELSRGGFGWQVIEAPQLGEKIAPNLFKDLLLNVVVASFLGGTAAILAETLDNRITNPKEVERQTSLPILGATPGLPLSKGFQAKLPFLSTPSHDISIKDVIGWQPFREALDVIYQNLKLSCLDSSLKSLAITSAVSGEGKSTFILGLAFSITRHQQRVLVIDADLRKPSLHKPFGLDNQSGLANFLAGEINFPPINQVAFLGETINLIPCGSKPVDPVKLLSSAKFQEFIDQQKQNYDLILIDTPPVLGMVDAIKIASICDSAVLMMRLDKVKVSEVIEASSFLAKLNVLGIVANGSQEVNLLYKNPSQYLLPQQV